jgi:1-acyl-sn-glycerol-3-phosphate acyltransferase
MYHVLQGPEKSLAKLTGNLRGVLCVILFLPLILCINVIQVLSVIFWPFSHTTFRKINRLMAQIFWGWTVIFQKNLLGVRFVLSGDKIEPRENALMFSNHQQLVDIPVLLTLAMPNGRIGDFKWFVKDIIKYIPGIGWGMLFLNCIFVKRSWAHDEATVKATFHHLIKRDIPFWVVSFVEGTRITQKKLEQSQNWAKRRQLPIPQYTLAPRSRGFVATVEGLGGKLDAIYDITIGYPEGIPTFWQYGCGHTNEVHIHIRRTVASVLPKERTELKLWLEKRFQEKDILLAKFAKNGDFN